MVYSVCLCVLNITLKFKDTDKCIILFILQESKVKFHVIGLKCQECGSYNTCRTAERQEETLGAQGDGPAGTEGAGPGTEGAGPGTEGAGPGTEGAGPGT